jgi:hypothetical protein
MASDVAVWWLVILFGLIGLAAVAVFFEIAHHVRAGRRGAREAAAEQIRVLADIRLLSWESARPGVPVPEYFYPERQEDQV